MVTVLLFTVVAAAALPGGESYLAGREAERAAQYADALAAYESCLSEGGPLAAYAQVRMAHCRSLAGDVDGAIEVYQHTLAGQHRGPWTRMAGAYLALLYAKLERRAEAAPLFAEFTSTQPVLWWFDRYTWPGADNLLAIADRREEGYAFFRDIVATTVFLAPRREAANRLARSSNAGDRLTAAFAMLRSGASKDAGNLLLALASSMVAGQSTAPEAKDLDQWALAAAPTEGEEGPPWSSLLSNHGDGPTLRRLWLAYVVRREVAAGNMDRARTACDVLVTQQAGESATAESLWALARQYERQDEPRLAIEQYQRLAATCPVDRRADDALLAAARLHKSLGEDTETLAAFTELRRDYPESPYVATACYLGGVLREKQGDREPALEDYTAASALGVGNYYAHRAYARLIELGAIVPDPVRDLPVDGAAPFLRPFVIASEPPEDVPAQVRADPRFQRLAFFGLHGLEEGEWEALHIGQALKDAPDAAGQYEAMAEAGLAHTALEFASAYGWGMEHDEPTVARRRIAYPRAFWGSVCALARETGVDPYLILSVARQESTFRPSLVSSAGARGVMQVMPGTAEWVAKVEPGVEATLASRLDAPLNSLRIGAFYLQRMIERSGGNLVDALASYNAGPGNLSKWRKRFPDADLDTFIEAIPFPETRDYVKAVLANYAAYYSLYPPAVEPVE